jgi:hypothetical protein
MERVICSTRQRQVVVTLWPLCSWGKSPGTHCIGGWVAPRVSLHMVTMRRITVPAKNQVHISWLSSLCPSHYTDWNTWILIKCIIYVVLIRSCQIENLKFLWTAPQILIPYTTICTTNFLQGWHDLTWLNDSHFHAIPICHGVVLPSLWNSCH